MRRSLIQRPTYTFPHRQWVLPLSNMGWQVLMNAGRELFGSFKYAGAIDWLLDKLCIGPKTGKSIIAR